MAGAKTSSDETVASKNISLFSLRRQERNEIKSFADRQFSSARMRIYRERVKETGWILTIKEATEYAIAKSMYFSRSLCSENG
jgi:hypothetical protein